MFNKDVMRVEAVGSFVSKVYAWMFLGLSTTAVTAYVVYAHPFILVLCLLTTIRFIS